jgi:excinuclease ABC subunit A
VGARPSAVSPPSPTWSRTYRTTEALDALGYDIDRPWCDLTREQRDWILFTEEQPVVTVTPVRDARTVPGPYEGTYTSARRYVLHTIATTRSDALRRRALGFTETVPCATCATCAGRRLRPEALAVTVAGLPIDVVAARPVEDLLPILDGQHAAPVAVPMLTEIRARMVTTTRLGLGHLGLDRPISTLSADELQRLRLAKAVTGTLIGVGTSRWAAGGSSRAAGASVEAWHDATTHSCHEMCHAVCRLAILRRGTAGQRVVPPAGFEPALPPPEGGALSPELRGPTRRP